MLQQGSKSANGKPDPQRLVEIEKVWAPSASQKMVHLYKRHKPTNNVSVYVESNLAGCLETWTSTTGMAFFFLQEDI